MLCAWTRGDVCVKRSGAREACCGPGHVAVSRHGDLELGRHAVRLETWRCRGMEIWSAGGMLCAWRRGGVCLKRSGAREVC